MIEKKRKKKKKKKKKKEKKKKNHFFFFFFFKAIKFTESAAFCRVGRVTGNNNKFLLGLMVVFDMTISRQHSRCLSTSLDLC